MATDNLVLRIDRDGDQIDLSVEREALAESGAELRGVSAVTEEEIIAAAANADVVITAAARFTRRVMASLPKLRAIIRYGVGYDTIDLAAATELGVLVINNPAPAWCAEEVSNQAMLLLLACAKKLVKLHSLTASGNWREAQSSVLPMASVHGQVAGLIGCGAIGGAIVRKAKAFGMDVLVYDPYLDAESAGALGAVRTNLPDLLTRSDFVLLQTPLTDETRSMIGAEQLKLMKNSAYLINCARGEVIDEAALIEALQNGRIAGAGLDVFEQEPPHPDNPLFRMDNVALTPHCASWSTVAFHTLYQAVGKETAQVLRGEMPEYVVNKEASPRFPIN